MGQIEAKRSLFIPQIRKNEAKRSLFIPQIRKNEAKQSLFIPQIRKIPEIGKIEAKKNELNLSKTNRANIFKTIMEPRIRFQGIDSASLWPGWPEPVFLNFYGAQESIPTNEFRRPM
jgi:hypothetical protein